MTASVKKTSWDDPAFCNRVLARADRHAKIRAQVQAGNFRIPKATARQRWDHAVEQAVAECGGNHRQAVALVASRRPKLRELLIAEANRR